MQILTKAKVERRRFNVAISGYYGYNNAGDEAVLAAILQALEEAADEQEIVIDPVILSADPAMTARRFGTAAASRTKPSVIWQTIRSCDALISGGGSLLQDVTGYKSVPYYLGLMALSQQLKKPCFVYSQGIGPIQRPMYQRWTAKIMKQCAYVSVRDTASLKWLSEHGISGEQVELVPDPVFGLQPRESEKRQQMDLHMSDEAPQIAGIRPERSDDDAQRSGAMPQLLGVAPRRWRSDGADLEALATALEDILRTTACDLRLYAFHDPADGEVVHQLKDVLLQTDPAWTERIQIAPIFDHPADLLQDISTLSAMLAMRLHALIFAANRGVPVAGFSYDPKIDQFMEQIGDQAASHTANPNGAALTKSTLNLLRNKAVLQQQQRYFANMVQKSQVPAKHIAWYLRINTQR